MHQNTPNYHSKTDFGVLGLPGGSKSSRGVVGHFPPPKKFKKKNTWLSFGQCWKNICQFDFNHCFYILPIWHEPNLQSAREHPNFHLLKTTADSKNWFVQPTPLWLSGRWCCRVKRPWMWLRSRPAIKKLMQILSCWVKMQNHYIFIRGREFLAETRWSLITLALARLVEVLRPVAC